MKRKYFGTDGIRGRANKFPMTAEVALKVAMATASVLRSGRDGAYTNRVVIGKDTRLSGYMLEEAMCAGCVSMGMNALLTGPIPTPAIAMLTRRLRADVGVMISASHNSFQDNGIKLFGADGFKLVDDIELKIEVKLEGDPDVELAAPEELGKAKRIDDALGRYGEYIKGIMPRGQSLEGLKVVVDCAHGAAYKIAPQVLWELEAEVISIGVEPNGRNINDGYGAMATENLEKAVLEHGADIGLALDGDADRLIVVDEKGQKVDGDQLMAALVLSMKSDKTLEKNTLVSTVMSNLGLERFLQTHGLNLVRTQVGDRYVVETMRSEGYNIGGEQSGHIVLSDYSTTGDGLLAALQVLSLLKRSGQPASKALSLFTPFPQVLRNVKYKQGFPLDDIQVQDVIKKAQKMLSNDGRVLVRASGTEPVIRVMVEGCDQDIVENLVSELCEIIEKVAYSA